MHSELNLNEVLLQKFCQLITLKMGFHIRKQDLEALSNKIEIRCRLLKLTSAQAYYELLSIDTTESHEEWHKFVELIAVGESYFLRDQGQFSLLRNQIIPELIRKNSGSRSLSIWSAGCSTGEEPYSLAILLAELIPNWHTWKLSILGTDINPSSLEIARQGLYQSWSFRLMDESLKLRYFKRQSTGWKIESKIRNLVKFNYDNLIDETFIPSHLIEPETVDLILCRNVFVYFDPEAITSSLKKIFRVLKPNGYLLTAHTELYGLSHPNLDSLIFPDSIVYQKKSPFSQPLLEPSLEKQNLKVFPLVNHSLKPVNSDHPHLNRSPPSEISIPVDLGLEQLTLAQSHFIKKQYSEAIQIGLEILQGNTQHFEAYYLLAQAYANLGNLEKAIHYATQAMNLDPFAVTIYYLLAEIAEEQGQPEMAKTYLKKIIYLEPNSIAAYLELGSLYAKEGELSRARKMWTAALELLKKLPACATVEKQGAQTAGDLLESIQKILINSQ